MNGLPQGFLRRSWGSGTSRWEGSTWYWAPLVHGVGIDDRTTQSPACRGASPKRVGGGAGQPADAHSNACFAAEVQTISEAGGTIWRPMAAANLDIVYTSDESDKIIIIIECKSTLFASRPRGGCECPFMKTATPLGMVSMLDNGDEDWSFGSGRAQFLTG
jgi:hypothetical protein